MPPSPDSQNDELAKKTIARLTKAHAAHRDSFVMTPGRTIDPSRAADAKRTKGASAHETLPKSGLEMGKTLWSSGMGVVRQARQLALDRDVAVKTIQPKLACDLATRMLMQEALILVGLSIPTFFRSTTSAMRLASRASC